MISNFVQASSRLVKFCLVAVCGVSFNVNAALIDIGFIVDGDTYNVPFTIENNSGAGLDITRFAFDLRPRSEQFLCFDEGGSDCHPSAGRSFTIQAGDDVGYLSNLVTDAVGGIDSFDFLSVSFDDFNPGEIFSWLIDIDDDPDGSVFGNDLIGSTFLVEMSNGLTYQGVLEGVDGNIDASQLRIIGESLQSIDESVNRVPEPNSIFMLSIALVIAFASKTRK